jgi:hypothetical protein
MFDIIYFLIEKYGVLFAVFMLFTLYQCNVLNNDEQENCNKENRKEENRNEEKGNEENRKELYEDKYWDKYNRFPNEYSFNNDELEKELIIIDDLTKEYNEQLTNIQSIFDKITKINELKNRDKLFEYYYIEIDEEQGDIDELANRLYDKLQKELDSVKQQLVELREKINEDNIRKEAREKLISQKLDGFINNYITEKTPLGNVIMRYNNNRQTFDYYSNSTIPYRYLEPVARKYVTTYWCKPLYVNINDELKKAEEKVKLNKQNVLKEIVEKEKDSKIYAKLKGYNSKPKKEPSINPSKNRNQNNIQLPKLVIHSNNNESKLLKENANRYTWEGRLVDFKPLKHIDRKVFDSKLSLSYSDYKKMIQNKK